MTEATKTKRVQLNAAQGFALASLVQENYVFLELYDPEFAAWATERLGFPVPTSSVTTARNIFGLESTLKRLAKEKAEEKAKAPAAASVDLTQVLNEMHALQQMIAALDKRITTYFN